MGLPTIEETKRTLLLLEDATNEQLEILAGIYSIRVNVHAPDYSDIKNALRRYVLRHQMECNAIYDKLVKKATVTPAENKSRMLSTLLAGDDATHTPITNSFNALQALSVIYGFTEENEPIINEIIGEICQRELKELDARRK